MLCRVSKLRIGRVTIGLSQSRLADIVSTYGMRLSRIERGRVPATADERKRIAGVLGMPEEELFDGEGRAR